LDFIEDMLKKPSIFLDESKLDINFVPETLIGRDKELSLLSQMFLSLITNPNSISKNVLITGKMGVGKTVTAKVFGRILVNTAKKRNINIQYIHINCRIDNSSYKVLIQAIRLLNKNFPRRGYSTRDLLEILSDLLDRQNIHLLIVLDELNYLINKGEDIIYSLTRINDAALNKPQRISIIGIVRDLSCLSNLDKATSSTLQRNIILFKPYSKEQTFNILKNRAEISIIKQGFTDEIIEMISNHVLQNGDIRDGLNILWKAGKLAESNSLKSITPECVLRVIKEKDGNNM